MTIPVVVVGGIGAVIAAALALIGVLLGLQAARITSLERRVDQAWSYNRRMWVWARTVIDLYLRHRRDGAPDLPPIPAEDE